MIFVSEKWKQAQRESLVPFSDVQIEYNITDPGLQDDATASATAEEEFSSAFRVVDEDSTVEIKYATLETNLWQLDGTHKGFDATAADGFVSSNICGGDRTFAEIPTITITLSKVWENTIPGVTITWSEVYGECAESFRIIAYNDDNLVTETTVTNNRDVVSTVWTPIAGYNRIVIEVISWCVPFRRARMLSCALGIKKIYNKFDLFGFTHTQTADLLSCELPKNSIVFELDNSDEKWNPDNPVGAEQYLIQRQTVKVKYGLQIDGVMEWIKAGTFYMSEWNTPSNGITASFTARDLLEFCSDIYSGQRSGSLDQIVLSALSQSGVDLSLAALWSGLTEIETDFTDDDTEYTCAEILQMSANAARCCMWQSREGVLHIEPLESTLTDYVIGTMQNGIANTYEHPEFDLTKELKSVNVNKMMGFAENSSVGFSQELSNPLIVDEDTAASVAQWCCDCLKNRKLISGSYRADPRLDVLDKITVVSKYSSSPVYVTLIKYTYNGAFRGAYEGRVVE